jgi:hypothetical protein
MTHRIAALTLRVTMIASAVMFSGCSGQPSLYATHNQDFQLSGGYDLPGRLAQERSADTSPSGPRAASARIAITHSFGLRLPAADIEAAQRRHLDECARLGCVVITTRLDRSEAGRVFANSAIRISPDGFAGFAKTLASPPAEVISHAETSEDKTIPLLDMEKRLELKSALRDRLVAMLKNSASTNAADLLAIERELTQVQGDIESATAQRDYLRSITDTVRVDISYAGTVAQTAGVDFYPIRHALAQSGQTLAQSVGQLITFVTVTLPWVPLVLLVGWLIRRGWHRMRPRARAMDQPRAAPAGTATT